MAWRLVGMFRVWEYTPIGGGCLPMIMVFGGIIMFVFSFIRPTYEYMGWDETTHKSYLIRYQKWVFGDSIYGGYAYYDYEHDFTRDSYESYDECFKGTISDGVITGDMIQYKKTSEWYRWNKYDDQVYTKDVGLEKNIVPIEPLYVGDGEITFNGVTLKGGRTWYSIWYNKFDWNKFEKEKVDGAGVFRY